MKHLSLEIIEDEHRALLAMLQSMKMLMARGPGHNGAQFFNVMRAMLFYIDEFPERQHHPKETELLFPPIAAQVPALAETLAKLERDHEKGEHHVRQLQHLLLAWELLGESRRADFETAFERYMGFYREHMRLEETEILPRAKQALSEAQWAALDAAFEANRDPLTGKHAPDAAYQALFQKILNEAPAPIGLGKA